MPGRVNLRRFRAGSSSNMIPRSRSCDAVGALTPRCTPSMRRGIEDLERGDFVKVDCVACHRVALLTPEALLRQGLRPVAKVLDLKGRLRCRGCGRKGRAEASVKWRGQGG
jgi:hypothetical protein